MLRHLCCFSFFPVCSLGLEVVRVFQGQWGERKEHHRSPHQTPPQIKPTISLKCIKLLPLSMGMVWPMTTALAGFSLADNDRTLLGKQITIDLVYSQWSCN